MLEHACMLERNLGFHEASYILSPQSSCSSALMPRMHLQVCLCNSSLCVHTHALWGWRNKCEENSELPFSVKSLMQWAFLNLGLWRTGPALLLPFSGGMSSPNVHRCVHICLRVHLQVSLAGLSGHQDYCPRGGLSICHGVVFVINVCNWFLHKKYQGERMHNWSSNKFNKYCMLITNYSIYTLPKV